MPERNEFLLSLNQSAKEKKIIVEEPKEETFKIGNDEISSTTSKIFYLNEDGDKCDLYVELEEKDGYINQQFPFGTDDKDDSSIVTGYQVQYTLFNDNDNKTPKEERTKKNMDTIWNAAGNAAKKYCDEEHENIPENVLPLFLKSVEKGFKPWAEYPKKKTDDKKKKKEFDTSKSPRGYLKFATSGKGAKLRCQTKIYGPGDKRVDVRKYVSTEKRKVRGNMKIILKVEAVYYGGHGKTSYGASLRCKISEMNFKPSKMNDELTKTRMLPRNDANEEDDISDEEGTDYQDPMGGAKQETEDRDFEDDDEGEDKKDSEDEEERPKKNKSKKKDKKDSVVKKAKGKSKKKYNSDDEDED